MTVEPNPTVGEQAIRLQRQLGYQFQNPALLKEALTHPSFSAENKSYKADNQRLEFLGDSVLQLALTEALFLRFPDQPEGVLTQWRSRLVSKPALSAIGVRLQLGEAMRIGRGEVASGGRQRDSTLADCVEAVLGAVYLDGGFEAGREAVLTLVGKAMDEVIQSTESGNPKGELQEELQALTSESPVYRILSATGPDHSKQFVAVVTWQGQELGEGRGASKKAAESAAATQALAQRLWKRSEKP